MARKITTLYINDTSIRLMVTRGKRITKLADAPLNMNLADISAAVREAEIATKITQLFKANKIQEKKVIVGLSGLHSISRSASLPQLPDAMLDEAMRREAERVMPVPPEHLYISWQVISANDGMMQAFIVAIPRQTADTLLKILQQVGLKPYLMDIKPLALARLVPEATAILVDVQSRELDIVIMTDGVPQPVRSVPLPHEALSWSDKLMIVEDEINRTVQFYNSNNPKNPIQNDITMYVSGELAEEPALYESLATELGYRVLPLTSPLKCPKQLAPAHYLVNIGLALKEMGKETGPLLPNINTLPVPYQPKQIPWRKLMALPAAAMAIGIIALLAMTVQGAASSIDSASSQLDTANHIIEKRQAQKKELEGNLAILEQELAATKAAISSFTAIVEGIAEQGDVINGDLEAAVNNLVGGINLMSISHSGGRRLEITGQAPSEAEILEYSRNLDVSGRFSEVTISRTTRVVVEGEEIEDEDEDEGEGDGIMDFTLSLKLAGTE